MLILLWIKYAMWIEFAFWVDGWKKLGFEAIFQPLQTVSVRLRTRNKWASFLFAPLCLCFSIYLYSLFKIKMCVQYLSFLFSNLYLNMTELLLSVRNSLSLFISCVFCRILIDFADLELQQLW